MTELEDPIGQIVDAVAETAGVEPTSLDPPLADVVDPDALETLLDDSRTADLEVQFTYRDHEVVVENGRVQVD